MNLEKTSKGSIKVTSQLEFILLMACLMSIVALSIDTILPALKPIGSAVGTTNANENQLLITPYGEAQKKRKKYDYTKI